MSDALSLLAPPEPQHGMKAEGVAEPLGLDRDDMKIQWNRI
jgi:hypothetical protein